ncbi:MAG: TIGR01777 family oxidoreductase [Anaerolineales bacterium]
MKVLIAGGTGLIGSALAESLQKDGHQVSILSRNPSKVRDRFLAVSWQKEALNSAIAENQALVNLAGESLAGSNLLQMRWTEKRKQDILSSRIAVGRKLAAGVKEVDSRPAVFIQASAIGYYGNNGTRPVDETTPAGDDFLARVCLDWEATTQEVEEMGVRRVIIRTGLVLSQKGGLFPLLALPFRLMVGGRIGSGKQYMSWIHITDVVSAIKYFLLHPDSRGIYNLTAPEPVTNLTFAHTLGKALHRPVWLPVPGLALKLLLGKAATLALDGRQVFPSRLLASDFRFQYRELPAALDDLVG